MVSGNMITKLEELDSHIEQLNCQQAVLEQKMEQLGERKILHVAVFGKYNHGKSSLLNVLAANGKEVFKVADIRETIEIQPLETEDIYWLDTPGLDADVFAQDDKKAINAILEQTDLVLFVHALEAGELDAKEVTLFNQLKEQHQETKKFILVLNRLDKVSPEQVKSIEKKIANQIQGLAFHKVSAVRYCNGMRNNKEALIAQSGVHELKAAIDKQAQALEQLRQQQQKSIEKKFNQLKAKRKNIIRRLLAEKDPVEWQQESFEKRLQQKIAVVADKIQKNNQQYI